MGKFKEGQSRAGSRWKLLADNILKSRKSKVDEVQNGSKVESGPFRFPSFQVIEAKEAKTFESQTWYDVTVTGHPQVDLKVKKVKMIIWETVLLMYF